jgi:hypothetical protein
MMQQRWPEPASLHPKLTAGTEDVCNFMWESHACKSDLTAKLRSSSNVAPRYFSRCEGREELIKKHVMPTYGIQLWGTASTSNIDTLERFQSKVLRMIVDDAWYVHNSLIRRDFSCPRVKEEIRNYSSHYGDRLRTHPNHLAVNLLWLPDNRRLRQFLPTDLPDRF